jgi:phosphoglycolate phosphatase
MYLIFDFDGTIANTMDSAIDIYNNIAPEYGCKIISKTESTLLQSKKPQDLMKELGVTYITLPLIVLRVRNELYRELHKVVPFPGIVDALVQIKALGFKMGVVTSNSRKNVELFFKSNNLHDLFDSIYTGKNIFGKDRVIEKYLKKFNINKELAIYIGDETRDVEATKRVGIPMVAVTWGFNSKEALEHQQPAAIVSNPDSLLSALLQIKKHR